MVSLRPRVQGQRCAVQHPSRLPRVTHKRAWRLTRILMRPSRENGVDARDATRKATRNLTRKQREPRGERERRVRAISRGSREACESRATWNSHAKSLDTRPAKTDRKTPNKARNSTLSPGKTSFTALPTSETSPANSCSSMTGGLPPTLRE